jgi:predicted heme/steroid binding protein
MMEKPVLPQQDANPKTEQAAVPASWPPQQPGGDEQLKHQLETSIPHLATYTKAQLALRNGQDRDEIWVAYRGLIYDVSRSRLWKRGNHYEHWAGQDLTQELDKDAPHNANVFDKFSAIGRLR